jgi:hypothetical protein
MCKYCDGWENRIRYKGESLTDYETVEPIGIVSNKDYNDMIPIENESNLPEGYVFYGIDTEINPKNGLTAIKLIHKPLITGTIDFDGVNIPINYCPICGKKLI